MLLSLSGVRDTFMVAVDCMSSSNSRAAASSWVVWKGGEVGRGKNVRSAKALVARKLKRLYHHLKGVAVFGIVFQTFGNIRRPILIY